MNTTLKYSLLRILLFLACLLVLWLLGLQDPLLLLLSAATLSLVLSLFLLSGLRRRMSADVAERVERRRAARAERSHGLADEDVEDMQVGGPVRATRSGGMRSDVMRSDAVQPDPEGYR